MVKDHLEKVGYQVETALSGEEAWAKLHAFQPDLVITDIAMPGIDGFELTRRIRQDPTLARVPLMMLTSKTKIEEKVAGFEAGADDYLTKPFDIRLLGLCPLDHQPDPANHGRDDGRLPGGLFIAGPGQASG